MLVYNHHTNQFIEFPMTSEEERVYTAFVNEDYSQLSCGDIAWGRGLWKKVNAYIDKLYWDEKDGKLQ